MVDTLTVVVSDGGRKKITITSTMASARASQIKLVLNHFPLLDMGVPLLYQTSSQTPPNFTPDDTHALTTRCPCLTLFGAIITHFSISHVEGYFYNYILMLSGEPGQGPKPSPRQRQKV